MSRVAPPPSPRVPEDTRASLRRRLALLAVPTVVLAAATLALTVWRLPTRVTIDLVTSRIAFTVRAQDVMLFEGTPGFSRLTVEGCTSAQITGARVRAAAPRSASPAAEHLDDVTLTCPDPAARLVLEGVEDLPTAIGSLDRFRLPRGAAVTLTAAEGSGMPTLTIDMLAAAMLHFSVARELRLTAEFVAVPPPLAQVDEPAVYSIRPGAASTWFALRTTDRTTLSVTPSPSKDTSFFAERIRIPIAGPQFVQETSTGLASALLGAGTLSYSEYPDLTAVPFEADDFVEIEAADLEISRLAFSNDHRGLAVRVEGLVSEARIGRPAATAGASGRWRDPRLTAYDVARQNSVWQLMAAVIAWAATTTWAWYEGWRRLAPVSSHVEPKEDR